MQIIRKTKEEDSRKIWNTELVNQAIYAVENGYDLKESPFYEKDIDFKKGNILFEYTDEELNEMKLCAKDVIYFANKYAYTMTDDGMQKIELRDYQVDVLRQYQENKEVVFMASRQIGKCSFYNTKCIIYNTKTKEAKEIYIGSLFEEKGLLSKIKKFLYKLLSYL